MSLRTLSQPTPGVKALPRERRAAPRRRCIRETSCQPVTAGTNETVPALLEDVSTCGIRLVLRRSYQAGRTLAVSWRHPPDAPTRTVLAQVVHASNESEGTWVVGCALMNALTEEEVAILLS